MVLDSMMPVLCEKHISGVHIALGEEDHDAFQIASPQLRSRPGSAGETADTDLRMAVLPAEAEREHSRPGTRPAES